MKIIYITFSIITIIITGCEQTPKESTPKFTDVTNIIINGEKISAVEYRDKYCHNKVKETFQDEQRCGEVVRFITSSMFKMSDEDREKLHEITKKAKEEKMKKDAALGLKKQNQQ